MNKYRSGSERRLADVLKDLKCPFQFEPYYIRYRVEQTRKYLPDFVLPNGIILEVKGRFTAADRQKQLLVRKSNLYGDIRIVFDNPNNKLYKGAKSTYADWCRKHGIQFCSAKEHKVIRAWVSEQLPVSTTGIVPGDRASCTKLNPAKPARKNNVPKRNPPGTLGRNKARDTNGTGRRKSSKGSS